MATIGKSPGWRTLSPKPFRRFLEFDPRLVLPDVDGLLGGLYDLHMVDEACIAVARCHLCVRESDHRRLLGMVFSRGASQPTHLCGGGGHRVGSGNDNFLAKPHLQYSINKVASLRLSETQIEVTQPTKVAGTLRRAVRSSAFTAILGERHMECAYYFDFCRLPPMSYGKETTMQRYECSRCAD